MAIIKPFKAIRPAKDKVAFVASKSYQEYSRKELNAILAFNPFSFLHIINPGYRRAKNLKGQERYKLVHQIYLEFLSKNVLLKDAQDCFYVYQIQKDNYIYCGLLCGASIAEYQNDVIKKHEATLQRREELFANYLKTVEFNAEPVLMTYKDNAAIAEVIKKEKLKEPQYDFTTRDSVSHKLWVISDPATKIKIESEFQKTDALYIADGHHRSASSNLYSKIAQSSNPNHTGKEPYNYFMSFLIPESEIKIYEFNRKIKDLNGLTKEEFLTQLALTYRIEITEENLFKPKQKHQFSMYLEGDFYSLTLLENNYSLNDALRTLDTQILYKTILEPILNIKDLRKDKRIVYGYGKNNISIMKEEIDKGKFKVGFSMMPINISEIKAIADAGLVMPPKSTYIEPKLRSGITIYEL
ncbi:DUF1015 domain-containing protein [Aurantibacter sp.]|uniref:DUF1015 domain-containing protein n=1 Tax=Aurantibacter sp. TaxID=2807103 RepID=UPI003263C4AF